MYVLAAEGQSDAEAAYEEAMNDIFTLQLECHRHQQPHTTHKGQLRWEMIEMWPMPVSCSDLFWCMSDSDHTSVDTSAKPFNSDTTCLQCFPKVAA